MTTLTSPAKGPTEEPGKRLAVLIDDDNAQPAVIKTLLEEVALFVEAIVRRIYGDLLTPISSSWKGLLSEHSIKAIQHFAYTVGKNATDSTMIIHAMDLLYTRRLDGFCLVTSDSDFTGIAVRLREEGLLVYGFGEQKTPEGFRNACHKFIYTEVLRPSSKKPPAPSPASPAVASTSSKQPGVSAGPDIPTDFLMDSTSKNWPWRGLGPNPLQLLQWVSLVSPRGTRIFRGALEALNNSVDDSGWAHLGTFGSYLQKIKPDFDTRMYGFKKISNLVRGRPDIFCTDERDAADGHCKTLYVRAKNGD
jgi:hypothetical protein